MTIKLTVDEIKNRLLEIGSKLNSDYLNSTLKKHNFICLKCSKDYDSTPNKIFESWTRYQSNGCKHCAKDKGKQTKLKNSDAEQILNAAGIELIDEFRGVTEYHKMKCTKCGNNNINSTPDLKIRSIKKGNSPCDVCFKNQKTNSKQNAPIFNQLKQKHISIISQYVNRNTPVKMKCDDCGETFDGIAYVQLKNSFEYGCSNCPENQPLYKPKDNSEEKYTKILNNLNIELLEPFKGVKKHHRVKCGNCGNNDWSITPISKDGVTRNGCPECAKLNLNARYADNREQNLLLISNNNFTILTSDYKGTRTYNNDPLAKIKVKNNICGHEFDVLPSAVINGTTDCAICGPQKRIANATAWSKANSAKWKETAPEWLVYKSTVNSLTTTTYRNNKHLINPNNLLRGKAGDEGAYQLDHIVPIRFCFENNIPAELCADVTNLQMLTWEQNLSNKDTIKGAIPPLFYEYIDRDHKLEQYVNKLVEIFPKFETNVNINGCNVSLYSVENNLAIVLLPINKCVTDRSIEKSYKTIMSTGNECLVFFEDDIDERFDEVTFKINQSMIIK